MDIQVFDDILGQDKALGLIQSALDHDSVSHAYLFTGPRGCGKTMAALRLAAALNCEAAGCGTCPSCRKTLKHIHPDVEIVEAEDNVLKISQIRAIGQSIGLKPFEGRRKVYIIRNVETMNAESANALLKDLEEPPGYVVFALTAAGADGLLPTIVSRCQEIAFSGIPAGTVRKMLLDRGLEDDKAEALAALSGGSASKAIRLAEAGETADLREFVLSQAGNLKDAGVLDAFKLKDELMAMLKSQGKDKGSADAAEVIDSLASWHRDMLVFKETGERELIVNKDQSSRIEAAAAVYDRGRLTGALEVLQAAASAARTNANKELLLEYTLLALSGG